MIAGRQSAGEISCFMLIPDGCKAPSWQRMVPSSGIPMHPLDNELSIRMLIGVMIGEVVASDDMKNGHDTNR